MAQRPGASLPEACGDRATLKAAYRFFDNVASDPEAVGQRATRKQRALPEKESQKWLTSVAAVLAAHGAYPQTRFVSGGTGKPMSTTCWPSTGPQASTC